MLIRSLLFIKQHSFLLFAFLLGFNIAYALPKVVALAHGGDTNLIHACKRPITGLLRLVDTNDDCGPAETAVHWPATSGGGGGANPFPGHGTEWANFEDLFLNFKFPEGNYGGWRFNVGNMTGADFSQARFYILVLSTVNLTNANFENMYADNFSLSNSNISGANFANATLSNSNFNNMDYTGFDFSTVTFLGSSEWYDSTCPDGTDSNANGYTCIGHLSP